VRRYLLSGLLVCGHCRARLVVIGGSQHRYACSSNHHGGPAACPNAATVPREAAERLLLQPVIDDLLSPEAIAAGVRALREAGRQAAASYTIARPYGDEVAALERLVRDGVLSPDVAEPALAEARRKAQERRGAEVVPLVPLPSPEEWRATVAALRDVLDGDDVAAARDALRALLGDIVCRQEGDEVVAELTARSALVRTGTGIWVGSGGAIRIRLPWRRRP
jgi:site-specific DNA recombinase